jgi:hypothetical protein
MPFMHITHEIQPLTTGNDSIPPISGMTRRSPTSLGRVKRFPPHVDEQAEAEERTPALFSWPQPIWLSRRGAAAHFVALVREGGNLDTEEQGLVFGESLPKGLRIL